MPVIEIEQKSMLTDGKDDGLMIRILKENVPKIRKLNIQGRKLDIKISIKY